MDAHTVGDLAAAISALAAFLSALATFLQQLRHGQVLAEIHHNTKLHPPAKH